MSLNKSRNLIFVRPIEGELETSKKVGLDKDNKGIYEKNRYSSLTGKLTGVEVKEEKSYDGGMEQKVVLYITDDGDSDHPEVYSVKYRQESWFMQNFFAYVSAGLDLSKSFTLGVGGDRVPKSTVFAWVKQPGNQVEKDKDFPRPQDVKVGSKEVKDWSGVVDRINELVEEIKAKLEGEAAPEKDSEPEEMEEIPF